MLPVEILDHVLQDVHQAHKQSLKSCALVSHSFLGLTRQLLYQDIRLSLELDVPLKSSESTKSSPSRFNQFIAFLLTNSEQVASHVRRLTIDQKGFRKVDSSEAWQTTAKKLGTLLPELVRLSQLSIQASFLLDWTRSNDGLRDSLMKFCQKSGLESLEISYMSIRKEELLSFLAVPSVRLICIDSFNEHQNNGSTSTSDSNNDNEDDDDDKNQPQKAPKVIRPTKISDLTIAPKYAADGSSEVWSVVQASQTHLKSFKCYSSPYDYCILRSFQFIELAKFPVLQTFAICINMTNDDSMPRLIDLLSPLAVKKLEGSTSTESKAWPLTTLEICCDVDLYNFPSDETLDSWDWLALDQVLVDEALGNLEELEITVKTVVRGWNSAKRAYQTLENRLVEMFQDRLPMTTTKHQVRAGVPALAYT
ncbi:hypothetical protein CPB83DRAFT_299998 [Crepidotus variabilis]|uniref:Uncharacterized protein n=1 Tax=Crepidotus variabilis TaxID=179855 RepID=A0A9P6EFX4_9AGAR|nr:hypothetical protein CPB83DRAFT_299998 [Crepidotus variabilis]